MSLLNMVLQAATSATLKNAEDSGYDFKGWTDKEIAEDIINIEPALKSCTIDELEPFVKNYFDGKS